MNILESFEKSSEVCQDYGERVNYLVNLGQLETVGYSDEFKYSYMMTAFAQDECDLASAHFIRFRVNDYIGKNLKRGLMELALAVQSPSRIKTYKAPADFVDGIHSRIGELTTQIKEHEKSEEWKKKDEEKKLKEQFTRDLFQLKSPNPAAPALESFVQIKYNEKKGRQLVVETPDGRDVPAGKFKYYLLFIYTQVSTHTLILNINKHCGISNWTRLGDVKLCEFAGILKFGMHTLLAHAFCFQNI